MKFLIYLFIFFFIILLTLFYYFYENHESSYYLIKSSKKKEIIKQRNPLILVWNKCLGELFPGIGYIDYPLIIPNKTCPFNCTFTHDRKLEENASTIIFFLHGLCPINNWPKNRRKEQNYLMFTVESPVETNQFYNKTILKEMFNSSATYRLDSDIYMPYDGLTKITKETPKEYIWNQKEVLEIIKNKTKFAFQAVSNCNASSRRDIITNKINELIELKLVGKCYNVKCEEECYQNELNQHFFYLAFENSICINYVTEKFWNSLRSLTVPIVLNRSIFEGMDIPSNTFIAVDDFNTINELIEYLNELKNDMEKYLKYFEWTKIYTKRRLGEDYFPICKICEYATKHLKEKTKSKINFDKFWNDEDCNNNFVMWKK